MTPLIAVLLGAAALLEVGGDALVRVGLRGGRPAFVLGGMLVLGCYGLAVNQVRWDFGRLLGVYVAVFAAASIIVGRLVFNDQLSPATWLGLGLILSGGFVLQLGVR